VFFVDEVSVSKGMIKYVCGLNKESVLDIEGVVVAPESAITGATVSVELGACAVRCVSRAAPNLPFELEDASRPDAEADAPESPFPRVLPETRLDNRVLDLRTPANNAIFRLQSAVGGLFREALADRGFIEIHTPKLIAGASEGGASVFKLSYMGTPACLAQSPQLYKQARAGVAALRVLRVVLLCASVGSVSWSVCLRARGCCSDGEDRI
jgi:aspartyl/asparaginyl-tRNA synthetase